MKSPTTSSALSRVISSAAFSVTIAFSGTAQAAPLVYAPQQKIVQGTKTLNCVGLRFQGQGNYVTSSQCRSVGSQIGQFYHSNSRGLLSIKSKGYGMNVALNSNAGNYMKAVGMAKAKYPGADLYAITGNPGTSHAGNGVAYLQGALYRDAQHEVGHLLGLGHAGSYKFTNGKPSLDAYGDGGSVMSAFPSAFLTAPQYYSLGWLQKTEAALYQPNQTYELRKISAFKTKGLALVIVNPKDFFGGTTNGQGRTAYISFPSKCYNGNSCAAIHLGIGDGAGTQKVATFSNEYYDDEFTGLHVKILDDISGGLIKVAVDFATKPAGFQNDATVDTADETGVADISPLLECSTPDVAAK